MTSITSEQARRLANEAASKAFRAKEAGTPLNGNRSLLDRDEREAAAAARYFRQLAVTLEQQGK